MNKENRFSPIQAIILDIPNGTLKNISYDFELNLFTGLEGYILKLFMANIYEKI